MSETRFTKCDGCGETTPEARPYISNGDRAKWLHVEVNGPAGADKRDACSPACLGKVLREVVAEYGEPS